MKLYKPFYVAKKSKLTAASPPPQPVRSILLEILEVTVAGSCPLSHPAQRSTAELSLLNFSSLRCQHLVWINFRR